MATTVPAIPSHLHFPPEVWSITAQSFRHRKSPDELTYLWTTVRHVSRQFKEEIEDIFRTEHLPKTWLYVDTATMFYTSPNGRKIYDFDFKLNFDKIQPRYPGRAVFSLSSINTYQKPEISAYKHKMFNRLRDEVGTGRVGEADKSVSGSRIRLFECPGGMFVVQVRGSVGDCALPALNIDHIKHELSFDWRDLFDRFFGERKLTTTVLHGAPMDQAPAPAKTTDDHNAPKGLAKFDVLTNPLNPHLQALARLDFQTYIHHIQVSNEGTTRIERLKNPIQTWTETLGEEFGQVKATLRRCRLRRQAEQEIDLDDEGNIDQVRLAWEREGNEAANDKGRSEWYALTQACDTCRTIDRQCERGHSGSDFPRDCNSCLETGSLCNSSLACLNISRPHYVSPAYQIQLMLLEQQNRRRLLMARQEQDTMGQSSAHPYHRLATASSGYPSGNHALQDFQMQMMLLDQQNKKRHIMARQQPNSMGLPPSLPLPNLSGSIISPHETRRSELHASAPRERNEQCLLDNLQGPVAGGQHLGSGPNQPVTNG